MNENLVIPLFPTYFKEKKNIVENIFMYVYYKIWNSIIFI